MILFSGEALSGRIPQLPSVPNIGGIYDKLSAKEAFSDVNKKFDTALETLKSQHNDHEQFIKGLQFLKQTDDIRKTNLLEHFPEFLEYYTTCNQLT